LSIRATLDSAKRGRGAVLARPESPMRSRKAFILASWAADKASLVALRSSAAAKTVASALACSSSSLDEDLKLRLLELAEASERNIIILLRA
jgi:hypothetical protein